MAPKPPPEQKKILKKIRRRSCWIPAGATQSGQDTTGCRAHLRDMAQHNQGGGCDRKMAQQTRRSCPVSRLASSTCEPLRARATACEEGRGGLRHGTSAAASHWHQRLSHRCVASCHCAGWIQPSLRHTVGRQAALQQAEGGEQGGPLIP